MDFYDIPYGEILGESEPLPRGEEYALPLKERIPIANDVQWELGHEAEARAHYQTYLELLGPADRAKAPERVMQRLK